MKMKISTGKVLFLLRKEWIEMVINVEMLAAWIGTLSVIVSPAVFVLRKYSQMMKKLDAIYSWTEHQQSDIDDEKQNRLALNRSVLFIARSMKAQGYNSTIDEAIKTLEDTIFLQQVDGVSYSEKRKNDENY